MRYKLIIIMILSSVSAYCNVNNTYDDYYQSPINLSRGIAFSTNLDGVDFNYDKHASLVLDSGGRRLRREGRRLAFRALGDNFILLDGKRYRLNHIDFKRTSEHVIEWKHFPLEVQFVHQGEDGHYVVLSSFVTLNKGNRSNAHPMLERLVRAMARHGSPRSDKVKLLNLFPQARNFYRYQGTLTTRPFQKATWIIFSQPIEASVNQIWDIEDAIGGRNGRDIQLPDGREIYFDSYDGS